MTGGKRRGRHHATPPELQGELERAEAELVVAQQERRDAEEQVGFVARLREGWERVHERNNLAGLFTEEYGRIK